MRLLATRLTAIASAVKRLFSPASLFRNAEQGVWYDPSDFSTLFQDSAGTTPVTAVEQPVGLILDKSKGLVLGEELVVNGTFDSDTGWTKGAGWSIDGGKAIASAVANAVQLSQAGSLLNAVGKTYKVIFTVSEYAAGQVRAQLEGASGPNVSANGTYTQYITATVTNPRIFIQATANGTTLAVDNISVCELPGNHATQATAASRPILKQDANGKYYLLFDGVDDSLATAAINFTATDKMTVFAGVRKLSDAASGCVVELGATVGGTNGSFALLSPSAGGAEKFNFASRGSVTVYAASTSSTYAAPFTAVQVGIGAIAGNVAKLRLNRGEVASLTTDQGTGNYSSNPLYIGRRGGTTLPFNGHLYSLIVRGAQSTDSQIVNAENYVNSKTGAY